MVRIRTKDWTQTLIRDSKEAGAREGTDEGHPKSFFDFIVNSDSVIGTNIPPKYKLVLFILFSLSGSDP